MPERELLLPDEAHLAPLTHALRAGWVEAPLPVRWVTPAEARGLAPGSTSLALTDLMAYPALAESHAIVADVAVTARFHSVAALLSDQRPDFLESVEIDASAVSLATAILARILGSEHFGATGWRVNGEATSDAAARLLEGDAAMAALAAAEVALDEIYRQAPGAETDGADEGEGAPPAPATGYAEDLGRAWFVLTGLPWVSAVLLAPRAMAEDRDELRSIVAAFRRSLQAGSEQEATVVETASGRLGVPEALARRLFGARRYELATDERKTVDRFFGRAMRHRLIAPLSEVAMIEAGE